MPSRLQLSGIHWPIPGAFALLLVACGGEDPGANPQVKGPPPSVEVTAAVMKPVGQQVTFVGRVAAVDKVELRARVEGFLKERTYGEGRPVAAEEVLFVIEPDQYEAIVAQRQADLAKAQAEVENAQAQFRRGEELLKQKNMSAAEVDKLRAAHRVAEASVEQAKAALAAAQLDLDYTQIKAPVAGRVGRAALSVGNLVGPSSGILATLVSQDPIHVFFPITQRELLEEKRRAAESGGDARGIIAHAKLPDGSTYQHPGRIDFVDVTTDAGTDTVTLRAVFPNPEAFLVDGQYLGVMVAEEKPADALLIPQAALQIDQQGAFVLVLDAENRVQTRRIQLGGTQGGDAMVLEGLKAGELVITQGLQKVRPGQVVSAAPSEAPAAPTGADQVSPTAPASQGGDSKGNNP